jgi:hypothetical protein
MAQEWTPAQTKVVNRLLRRAVLTDGLTWVENEGSRVRMLFRDKYDGRSRSLTVGPRGGINEEDC